MLRCQSRFALILRGAAFYRIRQSGNQPTDFAGRVQEVTRHVSGE
jgi:hypothetical protein